MTHKTILDHRLVPIREQFQALSPRPGSDFYVEVVDWTGEEFEGAIRAPSEAALRCALVEAHPKACSITIHND